MEDEIYCPAVVEEHGSRSCPSWIVFVANGGSGSLVKGRCITFSAKTNWHIDLRTFPPCVPRVLGDYSMCLSCVYTCGAVAAKVL